jgi:hypothetical protein
LGAGKSESARERFLEAHALARNEMERRFLDQRMRACERGDTSLAHYEQFWNQILQSLKAHVENIEKSKS